MMEMDKDKVDKTKENVGISRLDEKEKKQLFNKFVKSGGEVITPRRRKGVTDFDREKQKDYQKKIEEYKRKTKKYPYPSDSRPARTASPGQAAVRTAAAQPPRPGWFSALIERWYIRFKLFFGGITDFSASVLKPSFLERMDTEYKSALMEMQMIFMDLFRQNPQAGRALVTQLDRQKPLYTELAEMTADLFDSTVMNQIAEHHARYPELAQNIGDVREPLMGLFKKLYVLEPYQNTILYAFEKSIDYRTGADKTCAGTTPANLKRKIYQDLFTIFHKLHTKLYWLFCRYQGMIVLPDDPAMGKILGVTPEERPGRRKAGALGGPGAPLPEKTLKAEEKEKEEALPPEVRKGLELMFLLDLKSLRESFDRAGSFRHMKESDKALVASLLFHEFDQEYSFILTTNKIKFNTLYALPEKVDYKARLSDVYNELGPCMDSLRGYADHLIMYEKARMEKPLNNAQYIEYSKRLTSLEKERDNISRDTRMKIGALMDKAYGELKKLVTDMDGPQRIILNPQDPIEFELAIEGDKKLNGRKVYEGVEQACAYAAGLAYRLSYGGDLSGEREFKEGEDSRPLLAPAEKGAEGKEPPGGVANGQAAPDGKKEEGREDVSVIKELEDLF